MKMGVVLVIGGIVGTIAGGWLFALLQATGQIDTVIALIYVVLLGGIGGLMAMESLQAIAVLRGATPRRPRKRRHRSEEHTSELQSLMRISYAVFCLKKKKIRNK